MIAQYLVHGIVDAFTVHKFSCIVDNMFYITALSPYDTKTILMKIAVIEAHQRQHSLLLQHILAAVQKTDKVETCELPEGITLPLKTVSELRVLEATLDDADKSKQLVNFHSFLLFWLFFLNLAKWQW